MNMFDITEWNTLFLPAIVAWLLTSNGRYVRAAIQATAKSTVSNNLLDASSSVTPFSATAKHKSKNVTSMYNKDS